MFKNVVTIFGIALFSLLFVADANATNRRGFFQNFRQPQRVQVQKVVVPQRVQVQKFSSGYHLGGVQRVQTFVYPERVVQRVEKVKEVPAFQVVEEVQLIRNSYGQVVDVQKVQKVQKLQKVQNVQKVQKVQKFVVPQVQRFRGGY